MTSLCDLNIPWPTNDYKTKPTPQEIQNLKNILLMLEKFNYTHAVINFILDPSIKVGKKDFDATKGKSSNPIDLSLFLEFENRIKLYTRITLTLSDPAEFPGLKHFNSAFDVIAIKPMNEKALLTAITNLDIDILTFEFEESIRYWLKNKAVHNGIAKGRMFEIVYNSLFDSGSRKNFINASKNLIRASRSAGLVISSGAESSLRLKSKFDIEIMCKVLGISHHQIPHIINKNPFQALLNGKLRIDSHKQAIVVGNTALHLDMKPDQKNDVKKYKRKIDDDELGILNKIQRTA